MKVKAWWMAALAAGMAVCAGAEETTGPETPENPVAASEPPAPRQAASEEAVAWEGDMEAEAARANADGAQGDAWREGLRLASPVMDYAGVMGREDRLELIDKIRTGTASNGAQLVVVAVKSLRGGESRDFATRLFAQWGVGQKGKDNGVLFLVAVEERRVEIEVGLGFEGVLPDAKCGRLLDRAVVPFLKKDQWKAGIFGGCEALLGVMAGEDFDTATGRGESLAGEIVKWGVIGMFVGLPAWAIWSGRRKKDEDGDDGDDGGEEIAGVPGGGFAGGRRTRPRYGPMRGGGRSIGGFGGGGGRSRGGGAGRGF